MRRNTITVLVDNQAREGLLSEHGFALWIEAGGERILFDTGQSEGVLEHNAGALGIDLAQADKLVLSHGHYDHTGGLPLVLRKNRNIQVYCHPTILRPRYSIKQTEVKSVQIPFQSVVALNELPKQQIHWLRNGSLLNSAIKASGPIPRRTKYETPGGSFFLDPAGKQRDKIEDDLALWLRTRGGLVVCAGCAHAGLINTLRQALQHNRDLKIHTIIGGFHLGNADQNRLQRTFDAIDQMGFERIVPCHCTGERATALLRERFGQRISSGKAGNTYRFRP